MRDTSFDIDKNSRSNVPSAIKDPETDTRSESALNNFLLRAVLPFVLLGIMLAFVFALAKTTHADIEYTSDQVIDQVNDNSDMYAIDLVSGFKQEALCLQIALYAEAKGELYNDKLIIGQTIVNRVKDSRDDYQYQNTVCATVVAKKNGIYQYSGITYYVDVISNIVWGRNMDYVPGTATKNAINNQSWKDCGEAANAILSGKTPKLTEANHYFSPFEMVGNTLPSWAKHLKPVGTSGRHILYIDYVILNGKKIIFTKENSYTPSKHEKKESSMKPITALEQNNNELLKLAAKLEVFDEPVRDKNNDRTVIMTKSQVGEFTQVRLDLTGSLYGTRSVLIVGDSETFDKLNNKESAVISRGAEKKLSKTRPALRAAMSSSIKSIKAPNYYTASIDQEDFKQPKLTYHVWYQK